MAKKRAEVWKPMTRKRFRALLAEHGLTLAWMSRELDLNIRTVAHYSAGTLAVDRRTEYALLWAIQLHHMREMGAHSVGFTLAK